jgi:hypothetical protein
MKAGETERFFDSCAKFRCFFKRRLKFFCFSKRMVECSVTEDKSSSSSPDCSKTKFQESFENHGDNSYYYAHRKKVEIPQEAIRVSDCLMSVDNLFFQISGPGLVTGGPPVKINEIPRTITYTRSGSFFD